MRIYWVLSIIIRSFIFALLVVIWLLGTARLRAFLFSIYTSSVTHILRRNKQNVYGTYRMDQHGPVFRSGQVAGGAIYGCEDGRTARRPDEAHT